MKAVYLSIAVCLLMTGLVPLNVVGDDPYFIAGTVTNDDTKDPIPYLEIAFKNLRTNEMQYAITDSNGVYSFDLAEFDGGWQDGDYIEISPAPASSNVRGYQPCVMLNIFVHQVSFDLMENSLDGELAICMSLSSRQDSAYNIQKKIDDNAHIDCPSNPYNVLASCSWYEDAITQFEELGVNYTVNIHYHLVVKGHQDQATIGQEDWNVGYYTMSGSNQQQMDPLLAVSVSSAYDGHSIDINGHMEWWMNKTVNQVNKIHWTRDITITAVQYDW
jgi:hypothetical protein